MKEATGEVSMTVIVIVILALVLGLGTWLFAGEDAPARRWISDTFEAKTGVTTSSSSSSNSSSGFSSGSSSRGDDRTVEGRITD